MYENGKFDSRLYGRRNCAMAAFLVKNNAVGRLCSPRTRIEAI